MPRKNQVPGYLHHKPTGQAYVCLNGQFHYLGRWGTPESRTRYDQLLSMWLANGKRLPDDELTIGELILGYNDFAKEYYRKDGKPTKEARSVREAMRPLRELFTATEAREFGPMRLKAVREKMVENGLARTTINNQVGRIKRMFKWATENEMVPSIVFEGLRAVPGLRRGRTPAPEPEPVEPVPEHLVRAVLPKLAPQVVAMIWVQWWTGMRPGEVVLIRACDLDMSGKVWIYRPQRHKTEHHGIERAIAIGPNAQEVIRPWLKLDAQAYLFSPQEAAVEMLRRRRKRERPGKPPRRRKSMHLGEHYTTESYGRAIARACRRAKVQEWSPNQLRHSCATRVRKEHGLEAARLVLGHQSAATTEIYAEIDQTKSVQIMEKLG